MTTSTFTPSLPPAYPILPPPPYNPNSGDPVPPTYQDQPFPQYQPNPLAVNPAKKTFGQKFSDGIIPAFGMAAGTCLTLTGSMIGMGFMARLYLNTTVGLRIFKIFSAIFFPMGYACGLGAGVTFAVPIANLLCPIFALFSGLFFTVPFAPIMFGASLGYPGVQLTVYSYNHFRQAIEG